MYQNPILTKFLAKNLKLRVIGLAVFLMTTAALQAQVIFESSVTVENNLLVDGNVGIGNSDPGSYKLLVTGGNTRIENKLEINAKGSASSILYLRHVDSTSDKSQIWGNNLLLLGIPEGGEILESEALSINNEGRVGIGTNSPAESLDVRGNISLTGAILMQPQGDIPMFGQ